MICFNIRIQMMERKILMFDLFNMWFLYTFQIKERRNIVCTRVLTKVCSILTINKATVSLSRSWILFSGNEIKIYNFKLLKKN